MQRAPEQMVVDGGYISSNNIAEMAKRGIDFVGPESENKAAEANRRKSYKHHGVSAEYEASKFIFDTKTNTYVCPQGKHLRYDAKQESHGAIRYRYKASKQDRDALVHNSDRGRELAWPRLPSSDHLAIRHPERRHGVENLAPDPCPDSLCRQPSRSHR